MDRFDPFVKYADVYGDIINWEKDPMNKPQNQNKYFFSDGKTYYEQICKMLRLMSVFKEAFNQIYSNEDEISEAWENFVNNLSASVVEGSEPDVTLTWTDDSVNFEFTMVPGVPGEQGVGITSISFNSDYTMTITLSDGNTYTSMSLKGDTGPQGPQGETGSGLQILDVYATLADLQSAHPTGQPGDAYQVGSGGNYILYIWSSSQSAWVQAGTLGTVSPYTSVPLMDGTASAGSQNLYARGDHVHPTDTSRASQEELDALIKTSQALIDQSFTYRESPAIQDGLARIDKIKGNTLVWNQLIDPRTESGTMVGVDYSFADGAVTLNGTATSTLALYVDKNQTLQVIKGHKYYLRGCPSNGSSTTYQIFTNSSLAFPVGNRLYDWGNGGIQTAMENEAVIIQVYGYMNTVFNNTKFYPQLFDLTAMGLASLTDAEILQWFADYFSLPYYAYNQGSLLSFNGNGIKTVGKNLLQNNASSKTENGVTFTVNEDGTVVANGTATGGNSNLSIPYGLYLRKGNYFISGCPSDGSSSTYSWMIVTKYNGQWIQDFGDGRAFTMAEDGYCDVYFARVINGATVNNLTFKPMVTFQGVDDSFEPYQEQITSLPVSTYFPTGMKSAGSAYDELTPRKAITRIGAVDLGSINYEYNLGNKWFYSIGLTWDVAKPSSASDVPNMVSALYLVYAQSVLSADDNLNGIGITTSGQLLIRNASYTDATAFKSAMSGVYLYYELATPTETAVDLDLSFNAYEDGTEQLLPVNASVPSTSPIFADMTYLSIDDAMEYIIEKLANVPQNTQQILKSLEDDVADLQEDVGALQPAVSALQTSVGNINTNIGQLSSTVAGHTASISDMQSDISDLNTGLSNLEDTVTDNTSRIGTLETGLSVTNGTVQNLETSVSDLDDTVTAQGTTVTALDNFVSNIANTRNPGYMSSDNSIGITSAFLNMTLAAGQSTWANIPLPTIMAGFIPLFVVGASTGDGSVCLFKIPSTYNQNNIYKVGVKNTSNSEVTTQVGIEILCIKQRQSQ